MDAGVWWWRGGSLEGEIVEIEEQEVDECGWMLM